MSPLNRALHCIGTALMGAWLASPVAAGAGPMGAVDAQLASHSGQTGVHVLETGSEALQARAWLVDNAESTIEAQYFIWSTDNVGILAAEALLRAADRGVKVRVIVDDLLIKAPDKSLLALALHDNIEIKVYNPRHSVGTPIPRRVLNALVDFRGFNQRMHDKVFIVDGKVAITGGRNMAVEYFDYHHGYNFRDRDVVVLGSAVVPMRESFERFWGSALAVAVEERFDGLGLLKKRVDVDHAQVRRVYQWLHEYARKPANYSPEVRAAVSAVPQAFERVAAQIHWGRVEFICDMPGKNAVRMGLGGGGAASRSLAALARTARERIVIQSPYVVLSPEAFDIFRQALARGVRVRISTNSLASTDNLQAFSGYRNQRDELLAMGLELFEFKPDPQVMRELMHSAVVSKARGKAPIFAIHAKSMVVDTKVAYVGTYNFDPRSQNLNTEAGVVVHNEALAAAVEKAIEVDMLPANSWSAARDDPDSRAPAAKRAQVRAWQMAPLTPLL